MYIFPLSLTNPVDGGCSFISALYGNDFDPVLGTSSTFALTEGPLHATVANISQIYPPNLSISF